MTTENDGSTGSEETPGAAPEPEVSAAAQQQQQKPPAHAPSPGTKYVLNAKTGLYDVHRVDDEGNEHVGRGEDDLPEELKQDASKKDDVTTGVALPEILPDYLRDSPEIQSLVAEGTAALTSGGEYDNEAAQRVLDLVAQFELEIGAEQPNLHEEDRIRSMLKARWGGFFEGRLEPGAHGLPQQDRRGQPAECTRSTRHGRRRDDVKQARGGQADPRDDAS
jgi:hypothetical protein